MDKGIFKDREQAMEANYFRQQDARLVEKLRQEAQLDDIAQELAAKLELDNPELLLKVRELGVTGDTAPAFFLAHETVLRLARQRGIEDSSPAYAQLVDWLRNRPADALFDTATEVLRYGFGVLPPKERDERIKRVVDACHEVAAASGGGLISLLGLGTAVSTTEASMLETMTRTLRKHD